MDRKRETSARMSLRLRGRRSEHPGPAAAYRADAGAARPRAAAAARRRARTPRSCAAPRRSSSAATCSRSCPATSCTARATRPAAFFERLRTTNPAPYEFFFNLGEGEYLVGASPEMFVRVTGDRVETCPISGTIRRGERPAGGRRQHPRAPQLRQGRVGADDVHRRRPQRQVAGLRARQREGDRPPADRDVLPADPHRRPHRGTAAARLRRPRRVPHPHVGRHRDRRAQDLGDAVHRGPRGDPAALVRRRGRLRRLRRLDEHRPHPAHRPDPRRRRRRARRGHAAVRLRPRRRGARDPPQGARAPRGAVPAQRQAAADAGAGRERAGRGPERCCSSTTRTPSSTPWPTTSASRAPT